MARAEQAVTHSSQPLHCSGVEMDLPGFRVEMKSAGRAKGGTGAAVNTAVQVLADALGQRFDLQALLLEKTDSRIEIFLRSRQFEDDDAFTAGENARLQDIEDEIMLFDQLVDDRLFNNVGAVPDDDFSGIHTLPCSPQLLRGVTLRKASLLVKIFVRIPGASGRFC